MRPLSYIFWQWICRTGGISLTQTLNQAAGAGNTARLASMIAGGVDVRANRDYALMQAAASKSPEAVDLLVAAGCDPHACNDWALESAAGAGQPDTLRALLRTASFGTDSLEEAYSIARDEYRHVMVAALVDIDAFEEDILDELLKRATPEQIERARSINSRIDSFDEVVRVLEEAKRSIAPSGQAPHHMP